MPIPISPLHNVRMLLTYVVQTKTLVVSGLSFFMLHPLFIKKRLPHSLSLQERGIEEARKVEDSEEMVQRRIDEARKVEESEEMVQRRIDEARKVEDSEEMVQRRIDEARKVEDSEEMVQSGIDEARKVEESEEMVQRGIDEARKVEDSEEMVQRGIDEARKVEDSEEMVQREIEEARKVEDSEVMVQRGIDEARKVEDSEEMVQRGIEEARKVEDSEEMVQRRIEEARKVEDSEEMVQRRIDEARKAEDPEEMVQRRIDEARKVEDSEVMVQRRIDEARKAEDPEEMVQRRIDEARKVEDSEEMVQRGIEEARKVEDSEEMVQRGIDEARKVEDSEEMVQRGIEEARTVEDSEEMVQRGIEEARKVEDPVQRRIDEARKVEDSEEMVQRRIDKARKVEDSEEMVQRGIDEARKVEDSEEMVQRGIDEARKVEDSEEMVQRGIDEARKVEESEEMVQRGIDEARRVEDSEEMVQRRIEEARKVEDSEEMVQRGIDEARRVEDSEEMVQRAIDEARKVEDSEEMVQRRIDEARRVEDSEEMVQRRIDEARKVEDSEEMVQRRIDEARRVEDSEEMVQRGIDEARKVEDSEEMVQRRIDEARRVEDSEEMVQRGIDEARKVEDSEEMVQRRIEEARKVEDSEEMVQRGIDEARKAEDSEEMVQRRIEEARKVEDSEEMVQRGIDEARKVEDSEEMVQRRIEEARKVEDPEEMVQRRIDEARKVEDPEEMVQRGIDEARKVEESEEMVQRGIDEARKVEDPEEMVQRGIDEARTIHTEVEESEEMVQRRIDEAMESGSLQQRNVVGVITGPIGAGKTTLLCRLFGKPPLDLYTSTGVAEQSFRGLLHHTMHLSAKTWQRLSHREIRELLAPFIKAGMREADVDALASHLMHNVNPTVTTSVPTNSLDPEQSSTSVTASFWYSVKACFCSHPPSSPDRDSLSETAELPETTTAESATCKEMLQLVKLTYSAAPTLHNLVLEMVHMIDTGGQPELLQVMPSFIHNADLAIAVLNLEYSLSEHQQVDYHEEGEAYRRKTPFMVSGRDIILKLASTLHGKKSLHETFHLLIVATHRDCVEGDLEARVETLNRELHSLLLPAFENELLLYKRNKIAFVLDLKNPDDSDERALELIRRKVGKPGLGKTFETPISFFMFEQDLLKFAESEAKRDILSLNECKTVGARLKMSQEMVEAALVLFHRQNTFLYFHNVLPNHVFIKPQVPLDIINSIVAFSYKELEGVSAKLVSQLKNGIITEKLLSYDQISPHFQTGVYEVQDAIRLFCHTLTIAPLHHKEDAARPVPDSEREYLMMCLKPPIPDQDLHRHIPTSSDTVPLVVRFSSGCVPLGCFGSTISCLLSKYRWEVVRGEDGTPKCLACNIASLHDPQRLVDVLLVDFTQHLQVHVNCDLGIHQLPPNTCSLVLTTVFGAIKKVLEINRLDGDKMGISPAILCPCAKLKEKHIARFTRCGSKYFLRCSQTTSEPDEKQMLWMGNKTAHTKPTLPQLMELKIPEKVGVQYRKFGTLLLNDDTGILVDNAESCHYQPDKIVTYILCKWLQEGPTPVTWDNLIQVLRKCDLQTLADYVRDTHTMVT